ncbi:MAG TPA: hypothetical protein H9870_07475 [Candidatus Corynebacterium avicola]|uniref:Uncharacterized protein n=1 Tax=Candidatus Corynebacterium avicola TaxID=2838527 RepID=A0A9D1UKW1_9CORY|nr:hypothetical protein [Candidatus Corynebacterium avicola]
MPLKNTLTSPVRPMLRKSAVFVAAVGLAVPVLTACGETRSDEAFCEVIEENQQPFDTAMDTLSSGDLNSGVNQFSDAFDELKGMWPELADAAPEDIQEEAETLNEALGDGASEDGGDSADGEESDSDNGNILSGISDAADTADAAVKVRDYANDVC